MLLKHDFHERVKLRLHVSIYFYKIRAMKKTQQQKALINCDFFYRSCFN